MSITDIFYFFHPIIQHLGVWLLPHLQCLEPTFAQLRFFEEMSFAVSFSIFFKCFTNKIYKFEGFSLINVLSSKFFNNFFFLMYNFEWNLYIFLTQFRDIMNTYFLFYCAIPYCCAKAHTCFICCIFRPAFGCCALQTLCVCFCYQY